MTHRNPAPSPYTSGPPAVLACHLRPVFVPRRTTIASVETPAGTTAGESNTTLTVDGLPLLVEMPEVLIVFDASTTPELDAW